MALENIKKLIKHLEELQNGKVKTGNSTRDELIVADASKNLKVLSEKFPELFKKEEKKEEPKEKPKPKPKKKEE